jgi:hypothetical protein
MNEPNLPESFEKLAARLKVLHEERKQFPRPPRRLSLTPKQRADVLVKTDARCHLCGGEITENKFAADHVLSHASGGEHKLTNYLAAHRLCNGCRWFYSPEEFQWILMMGVWARKQMEDRTRIGREMGELFLEQQKATRKRRSKNTCAERSFLTLP